MRPCGRNCEYDQTRATASFAPGQFWPELASLFSSEQSEKALGDGNLAHAPNWDGGSSHGTSLNLAVSETSCATLVKWPSLKKDSKVQFVRHLQPLLKVTSTSCPSIGPLLALTTVLKDSRCAPVYTANQWVCNNITSLPRH